MNNSLISIIIPVYNVEKYLKECLDSVTNQTYKNLEIILVDDGSTDKSGEICDEFARQDSRIKVIHQKNQGQAAARNRALDIMQGEYLAFVDSDDMVDEAYIGTLFEMIQKYNTKIAMISFENFTQIEEIQVIKQKNSNSEVNSYSTEEFFRNYLISKPKFHNFICRCLYHRDIFANLRFPVGIIYEDVYLYYDIFSDIKNIIISNKILYSYRQNIGSTSRSFNEKHLNITNVYDGLTKKIIKKYPNLNREINLALCIANLMLAKMAMQEKNTKFKYKIDEYHKYVRENLDILFALKTNLKVGLQLVLFYLSPKSFEKLFLSLKSH
ncbi:MULTISPECIES: glycosyltransferase family 2 protein [unclassified Campylobacter]|uniref:glycosyltransferase family 2 protein n=1 Tax=unclassified Campylobacter TaxID=2593542 RepID=UPI0022EA0D3C|nr:MULTISPECIES: glycosyltransferase family 2 protein [unclassified Campylobacter]MDA3054605.1 glycosyltransferase [Campylobacter sp. VBCF_07 NA4]MDA3060611.1 glycosyltransferase [Campylobacter sp. VBCF_02 NA5]MDA3070123.1 glycosyltransferase [Campylobacter sp. VBCF_08 NA3]WBR54558.1 glycosyltransferase family 2 protein [Campylobacter sp. VBCF_01 NA2]